MPKTITIRYKDSSPNWPGDVAAVNGHNIAGGFHGPKYPGYQEPIPGDFLDFKTLNKEYKNRDQSYEMISEGEYRKRLYKTGGYHRQPGQKFHQAAPPELPQNKKMLKIYVPPRQLTPDEYAVFRWKSTVATLLFKEFNPLCMEFIGEMPEDALALLKQLAKDEPETDSTYKSLVAGPKLNPKPDEATKQAPIKDNAPADITKMDEINATKFVAEVRDVNLLMDYSAQESKRSRPRVAVAIETQIAKLKQEAAEAQAKAL